MRLVVSVHLSLGLRAAGGIWGLTRAAGCEGDCREHHSTSLCVECFLRVFVRVWCMPVHTAMEGEEEGSGPAQSPLLYSLETGLSLSLELTHCFPKRLANPSKHPAFAQACLVLAKLMSSVGAGDLHPGPSASPQGRHGLRRLS